MIYFLYNKHIIRFNVMSLHFSTVLNKTNAIIPVINTNNNIYIYADKSNVFKYNRTI